MDSCFLFLAHVKPVLICEAFAIVNSHAAGEVNRVVKVAKTNSHHISTHSTWPSLSIKGNECQL
jgi:hypothetical protein